MLICVHDRPEKDHAMQIEALARLFDAYPRWKEDPEVELVLIGSSRNQGDEDRIADLKRLAEKLGISARVRFEVNATYDTLVSSLGAAKIGLHTMWNEHFGIGVVEYMVSHEEIMASSDDIHEQLCRRQD